MSKYAVSCEFDPCRDCLEVVSGLAVNITDMLETGIVHDGGENLENNGIDDPHAVIGLVRDNFAAIDAMRAVRKYGKKNPSVAAAAVEGAAASSSAAPSNSNT